MAAILIALPAQAQLFGGDETARKQIAEQQKRIDALRQQNEALAERLAKIEEALKNQPVLALVSQIEALREEVRQLRGQIEVAGNNIDMASKRQRDMYVDLDTRIRRLEQAAAAPPPAPAGAAAPAPGPAAPVAGASPEETRAYEAAQNQRRTGNYQGAIAAFQTFLAQYPKSPLAHRAQYWIGDSYYNLREFRNAIASQQKLISTYPDSASVPDALLNIASSQAELGEAAAARKTLDGLVARYPQSDAAEKARKRLAAAK
jgi:tol-pal system protein YbgF